MIKAIFFDVDGTLVSHAKKEVCTSARKALKKLREQGIKCIMCTGRHILEIDELPARDVEFDAYITLVGQLSLDKERKPFAAYPFSEEAALRFVKLFDEMRYPMQLVEEDGMYINFINRRVEEVQADKRIAPGLWKNVRFQPDCLHLSSQQFSLYIWDIRSIRL